MKGARYLDRLRESLTPRVVLLLIMAAVAVIVASFWAYINYDPNSRQFCVLCHNMAPAVAQIGKTPHGAFTCTTCHSVDIPRWLFVQIVENPTSAQIAERYKPQMFETCQKCHKEVPLNIHTVHIRLAASLGTCTVCHGIHDQVKLTTACQTCHDVNKIIPRHLQFHSYAWAEVEKGNTAVCLECHSPWARWYVPIGPDCQIGVGQGTPCISCHGPRAAPFNPAQFTNCVTCHGR